VPLGAFRQYWEELYEDICLVQTLASTPALAAGADRLIVDGETQSSVSEEQLPRAWDGVLIFRDQDYLSMFRDEYYHAHFEIVDRAMIENAAKVRDVNAFGFADYWRGDEIVGALILPTRATSPAKLGIYEYACPFDGPYLRKAVPSRPRLISELPSPLRACFTQLCLPINFAQMRSVDPDKWATCYHYGR
jgi:hypothetical protein